MGKRVECPTANSHLQGRPLAASGRPTPIKTPLPLGRYLRETELYLRPRGKRRRDGRGSGWACADLDQQRRERGAEEEKRTMKRELRGLVAECCMHRTLIYSSDSEDETRKLTTATNGLLLVVLEEEGPSPPSIHQLPRIPKKRLSGAEVNNNDVFEASEANTNWGVLGVDSEGAQDDREAYLFQAGQMEKT